MQRCGWSKPSRWDPDCLFWQLLLVLHGSFSRNWQASVGRGSAFFCFTLTSLQRKIKKCYHKSAAWNKSVIELVRLLPPSVTAIETMVLCCKHDRCVCEVNLRIDMVSLIVSETVAEIKKHVCQTLLSRSRPSLSRRVSLCDVFLTPSAKGLMVATGVKTR